MVLAAEDVAFRIYESQLAHHFMFYRDMFMIANPQMNNSETFDGLIGSVVGYAK